MRKWYHFALVLALVIALTAGCASGSGKQTSQPASEPSQTAETEEIFNPEGYPIVDTPIELTMMGARLPIQGPWEDMVVLNEHAKRTNIKVNWEALPEDGFSERKNLLFASGSNLPDAFFRAQITRRDEITYGVNGDILIPLNDLIEKYAPNLNKLLNENPQIRKEITAFDGNIYSLPAISGPLRNNSKGMITYINKKWLDELELPVPSTTEEFHAALAAFKAKDPGIIPMSGTAQYLNVLPVIMGAWGIASDDQLFDIHEGKVRFTPVDEKYKEALQFTAKLYEEKLISEQMFTNTFPMYITEGKTHPMGVITTSVFWLVAQNWEDYVLLPPLKGPHGDQVWANFSSPTVREYGVFAITSKNPHPEATMRWVDYWYSKEGTIEQFAGLEGTHYTRNADGTWQYTDWMVNNPNGLNVNEARGQISPWAGTPYDMGAIVEFVDRQMNKQPYEKVHTDSEQTLEQYAPSAIMPSTLNFTLEEQQRVTVLEADIKTYVEQMRAKFIMGAESFDNWDSYVAQLEKMGYKELTQLVQTALER
jgi:ABC-type sugar transport system, periplasmic component